VRTIAHLSDLHFGREDPRVVEALRSELDRQRPSLVIVSGDLTQRARRRQFEACARFLRALPSPVLVVPGNHDIPLFDVLRRFLSPLGRYRRYIAEEAVPLFEDGELFVMGLNSARPWRWKDGALSREQVALISDRFAAAPPRALRLLVTHHPLRPRPGDPEPALMRRGPEALDAAGRHVDLALAGHLHMGYLADIRPTGEGARAVLLVQAGTAISNRRRHEPNSYNRIEVDGDRLEITIRSWGTDAFETRETLSYRLREGVWVPDGAPQRRVVA
jgi:3',5'-cyclic AMP phosphodiesterase CpdA